MATCAWCLPSSHCAPPSTAWPCLPHALPFSSCRLHYDPLLSISSQGWTSPAPTASPPALCAPAPWPSWWPSTGLAPVCPCLSCTQEPKAGLCSWRQAHKGQIGGKNHFPQAAGYTLAEIAQSDVSVPYQRAHCWVGFDLPSARTTCPPHPDPFPQSCLERNHCLQPRCWKGVIPPQKQDAAFTFVDHYEVAVYPFLLQVKVHLNKLLDL